MPFLFIPFSFPLLPFIPPYHPYQTPANTPTGDPTLIHPFLAKDDISLLERNSTTRDLEKSKEVVRHIDDYHALLNATYRSLLHSYLLSPPTAPAPSALLDLLALPLVKYVDLKYLDESGTSFLHETARGRDLRLIELGVHAGADVFVRDLSGKMAHEVVPKGKEVANQDQTLIMPTSPLTEPPSMKGYLNKYTNVAKGYNSRRCGVDELVDYHHGEDEKIASHRFEVHSMPRRGYHSHPQKWYLKANHPVKASRWGLALRRSVELYRGGRVEKRSEESEEGAVASVSSTRHSYNPAALLRRSMTRALDTESLGGMGTGTGPSPTDGGGIGCFCLGSCCEYGRFRPLGREALNYDLLRHFHGVSVPRFYGWFNIKLEEGFTFPGVKTTARGQCTLSVLVLERMGERITMKESEEEIQDICDVGTDVAWKGIAHFDIRYNNLFQAPKSPPGYPSEFCYLHQRIHKYRFRAGQED
ncbi:hypothetical protein BDQ17DRAFT_1548970 [Cyathus striatus]|nr:hypothetical protein BDQ17DRAFT_1548970 [Cyathus striatus]